MIKTETSIMETAMYISYQGMMEKGWTAVSIGNVYNSQADHEKREWGRENCRHGFYGGYGFWAFENEDDAVLFKLRWA